MGDTSATAAMTMGSTTAAVARTKLRPSRYGNNASGGNYYDATAYCSSIGASIATIHSATENELARQACGGSSCWIGLEEVGGSASTPKASQTWRWMDGSRARYTNWLSSEPQNHNGRDERN